MLATYLNSGSPEINIVSSLFRAYFYDKLSAEVIMWHQMRQQKVYVLEPKDREGMDPGLFSGSSPVFFWKD
jgi:hypothetical protein